jgi:hypothetical protein
MFRQLTIQTRIIATRNCIFLYTAATCKIFRFLATNNKCSRYTQRINYGAFFLLQPNEFSIMTVP